MMQTLDFPAGGRQINAKGTYFRYESSVSGGADDAIRVRADGNDLGTYLPGDDIQLMEPVARWEVVPVSSTVRGVVRVGMGRVSSARLAGTVAVIDSERDKVQAGRVWRAVVQIAGAAGIPLVQLWNPSGSGRNAFVHEVTIGASAADSWALSTVTNVLNTAAPNQPFNLNRAGAASSCLLRTDNANQVLLGTQQLGIGYVAGSSDRLLAMRRPILLRPGEGLVAQLNTATSTIRAAFEFEEWAQ